jgi:FKBP-type peptidyl-prolyl cis-trans isomerase FklB
MKRIIILMGIVTMFGLGSCTTFSHKSNMKTEIDTLSFFLGMARADGIMNYLTMQAGVDTAYMDAFYKGFREGAKHYSPKDVAYAEGMRIAHLMSNTWVQNFNSDIFMGDSSKTINRKSLLAGFFQGVKYFDETKLMHAQSYSQMKMESVRNDYKRAKYADMIAAGEKLLADNKNNPAVKTTSSGLQYKIIQEGTGAIPDDRAKVKVNYRGTLVDRTEFDSSYKNNAPSSFRVNGVIRGWSEALKLMPVGSKWELYIPEDLAYGSNGQMPTIPPFATLIFEVELLEIEPN